ncbi:MAG: hypothetical protein HYV09_09780 [Deltaproteobacteria bacterium]|nr:hypothetical protein [Deltaproteobacteria bacterium]
MDISRQMLAERLVRVITRDHIGGRRSDLNSLTEQMQAPRAEVRSVLSALHREGYLDVLRMRLTLAGFALGCSLLDLPVHAIARPGRRSIAA